MLVLLYVLSSSEAVRSSLPIERKACGAVIGNYSYDLHEFAEQRPVDHFLSTEGFDIYSKTCGSFSNSDVPSYFTDHAYWSLAICSNNSKKCFGLASKFSQNYYPIDDSNLSAGLVISHDGDPVVQFGDIAEDWISYYIIRCNAAQKDPAIVVTPRVSTVDGVYQIYFNLQFDGACPIMAPSPTPTPSYSPLCKLQARNPKNTTMAINVDLKDFNVPGGSHMYKTFLSGSDAVILYEPCERVPNPFDPTDPTLSSLWVCFDSICYDSGVANSNLTMNYDYSFSNNPVKVNLQSSNLKRNAIIELDCNPTVFEDSLEFHSAKTDGNNLTMRFETPNVCEAFLPPAKPTTPDHCYFSDSGVTFNASDVDTKSASGYVMSVVLNSGIGDRGRILRYQPCSGILCPTNAFCIADEDAHIWLCDKPGTSGDESVCRAYGLFENNISMSFVDESFPSEGIKSVYKAEDEYSAEVTFVCDKTVPIDQISMPSSVSLESKVLKFAVRTSRVCVGGPTPKPKPIFYPPIITAGPTPSPTPLPSPNALDFYGNDTYYILTDLENPDQTLRLYYMEMVSGTSKGDVRQYFSPFTTTSCPPGYDCMGYNAANSWSCWTDRNLKQNCYPIADSRYGYQMEPFNVDDLDQGAIIRYKGYNGVVTEIRGYCSPNASRNLYLNGEAAFAYSLTGPQYSLGSKTSLTCPRRYSIPVTPGTLATATPPPTQINTSYSFEFGNLSINLKLDEIPTVKGNVALGFSTYYEKTTILYSPYTRVKCLTNYDCQGYEDANVWKCFVSETGVPLCYPIGDMRYGLDVIEANESNPYAGISLEYSGGAGGYEAHMILLCNPVVSKNSLVIDDVGDQTRGKISIIYVHGSIACPKSTRKDRGYITGGAIFLIIVAVSVAVYVGGGMVYGFIKTGKVAVPNSEFWAEFGSCIASGAVFIFRCGKASSKASGYDAI